MARRESGKKARRIVMVANFALSYNRQILRGAMAAIHHLGDVHFYHCDHLQSELVFHSRRPAFDGVLLGACMPALRLPEVFCRRGLPAVDTSGEIYPPPLPRVITDDLQVGRNAAEYFNRRGFDRYIFVGYGQFHWSDLRLQGFKEALGMRGKPVVGKQVTAITYKDSTSWNLSSVTEELAEQLANDARAKTAIFCANDTIASSVVESCVHAGIGVPEQAAVLGVDDDEMCTLLREPYISSMQLQAERIGYEAMELILTMLRSRNGRRKPRPMVKLIPPDRIISRRSTDTVAVDDPLVQRAVGYIRDHLHEGLNVKELVHVLRVSRTTLEMRFKAGLGRLPGEEMRRQRMTRACDLLSSTQLPINAVGRRVGYNSAQLFSEAFRRAHRMTPLNYREMQRSRTFGPKPGR